MSGDKVHLFDLRERTNANGNRYLSGWLGKASVVAFLDREAEEPTWQIYVSTPAPRPAGSTPPSQHRANDRQFPVALPAAKSRGGGKRPIPPGELDDSLAGIGEAQ